MIEWLRRVDPARRFLVAPDRVWTYGDANSEVERKIIPGHRLVRPSLDSSSVFDILAGLSGGGLTVGGPVDRVASKPDADLVVFTSGTTGPPKGVRLTMANLEAASQASMRHLRHDETDNWILAMPLHHVGGLSIVVRQVYSGGSITLLPGFDPVTFAAAMQEDVTMVSAVPTMLRRIVHFGPFTGLRAVLVGGGPIPDGLLEEAVAAGLPVLPTYGMTETFGQVATLTPGVAVERKTHPLPGIGLRIEEDGRIAVSGAQVSPGYLGEPDRADPWFVTNDLGEIDEEGALRVLGRADNVIVTGGENVDPERIEAALREHEDVDDACVVGVEDEEWGQIAVGVYEGSAGTEELMGWIRERLPGHMVPKRLRRVPEIPRSGLGKPDRNAVAASGLGRDD